MKRPKCETVNPADSKFCRECATPLPSPTRPSVTLTKTRETPKDELLAVGVSTGWGKILNKKGRRPYMAYRNEGHGLRGMANRKNLTIRFFAFYDNRLKGAPARKWLTEGGMDEAGVFRKVPGSIFFR